MKDLNRKSFRWPTMQNLVHFLLEYSEYGDMNCSFLFTTWWLVRCSPARTLRAAWIPLSYLLRYHRASLSYLLRYHTAVSRFKFREDFTKSLRLSLDLYYRNSLSCLHFHYYLINVAFLNSVWFGVRVAIKFGVAFTRAFSTNELCIEAKQLCI